NGLGLGGASEYGVMPEGRTTGRRGGISTISVARVQRARERVTPTDVDVARTSIAERRHDQQIASARGSHVAQPHELCIVMPFGELFVFDQFERSTTADGVRAEPAVGIGE